MKLVSSRKKQKEIKEKKKKKKRFATRIKQPPKTNKIGSRYLRRCPTIFAYQVATHARVKLSRCFSSPGPFSGHTVEYFVSGWCRQDRVLLIAERPTIGGERKERIGNAGSLPKLHDQNAFRLKGGSFMYFETASSGVGKKNNKLIIERESRS